MALWKEREGSGKNDISAGMRTSTARTTTTAKLSVNEVPNRRVIPVDDIPNRP